MKSYSKDQEAVKGQFTVNTQLGFHNHASVKDKNKDMINNEKLILKILFLSYLKSHNNHQTITDCHSAVNDRINKLYQNINQNYEQISSIVNEDQTNYHKESRNAMQTIQQEDYVPTQRQNQGQQSIDKKNLQLVKKFNNSIGLLQKTSSKFQSIMFMYKNQIKSIAKELTQQKQLNKKLSKQLQTKQLLYDSNKSQSSLFNKQSSLLSQYKSSLNSKQTKSHSFNKQPLKQTKSNSLNKLSSKSNYNQSSRVSSLSKPSSSNRYKKQTKKQKQPESQDQQIRSPPKPFCQQCLNKQKQQQKRQKQYFLRQKQLSQQKNKWKELSIKITNLKNQLSTYEQQLLNKQSQINKLNAQITKLTDQLKQKNSQQNKTQTQEKKKLKVMNTTLRGQKIVLQNQIINLKKKLQENQLLIVNLQSQNKKHSIQRDNLQSTIKWHNNTIEDLRKNFTHGLKEESQLLKKYQQSEATNGILYQQINDQQKLLQKFVSKLEVIQNNHKEEIQKLTNQINQLHTIIQQKNQTIIKLKINKDQNSSLVSNLQQTNKELYSLNKPTQSMKQSALKQNAYQKRDVGLSGTILNKTLRKDQLGSSQQKNNNVNPHSHNKQGFQQNMIKILNKKLVDKESTIEKLIRQNEFLKAELQVYKQNE